MNVNDSVSTLKGVGRKAEENLARLGILTVGDLLMHYPRDYRKYEEPVPVWETKYDNAERAGYDVTFTDRVKLIRKGKVSVSAATIKTPNGNLDVVWYHSPFIAKQIHIGQHAILYGKVTVKGKKRMLIQPEILSEEKYETLMQGLWPVYDLTEGITQNFISKMIGQVMSTGIVVADPVPLKIRSLYKLSEINFAIRQIHFPENEDNLKMARKRLVFEEFFVFALALKIQKREKHLLKNSFRTDHSKFVMAEKFIASLPYSLTGAQLRVISEISSDMDSDYVMNRLIQGDVGSGKTMIAAVAMYYAVLNGYQTCLMAPTEVLARQHYENFTAMFEPFGVRIALLTGSTTVRQKREIYEKAEHHEVDMIIGTQALFQEKAVYANLGLIITDEQHRFGVHQREMLADKSKNGTPHVLVMSATPIPRTLAIILYSDLDISVVDEKPAHRLDIKNCVVGTSYRPSAYRFMRQQIEQGHQVYIICPMVEESENIEAENVTDYSENLRQQFPEEVHIACLHGKMKADEKQIIMDQFACGDIDILVSTTVIEVGVDVPNATVMMIENAERFGLAQLHQLRGRVGRGKDQSYCIFMYGNENQNIKERLDIMVKTNDGFKIAQKDLELRGPGDMFGIRQSGSLVFRIGDVFNDADVLMKAGEAADIILSSDPHLKSEENVSLAERLSHFSLGEGEQIVL